MLVALLNLHAKAWHGSRTLSCRILALIVEIVQNNSLYIVIVLVHNWGTTIDMFLIKFMLSFFWYHFFLRGGI